MLDARRPGRGLDAGAGRDPRDASCARAGTRAVGAFTQYFGSTELDASNLMMPIVGFLPADDPRMLATIEAVAARLTDERGLVYRYRAAAASTAWPARRAPSCCARSGWRTRSP